MNKRYQVVIAQSGKADVKDKKVTLYKILNIVSMLKVFP